jgi:hypothetical protein
MFALDKKTNLIHGCYIHSDYKFEMIIFSAGVLLRPLKCIEKKIFERIIENPWVRYSLKKMAGKMRESGGKFYTGPLGGVAIFPEAYGMLGVYKFFEGVGSSPPQEYVEKL